MSMPDIRRMGDDFVVILNGEVVRFESYDAAYAAWEEA
jgi:ABC-type Na+ transport system ATPase subunit NatA